MLNQYNRICFFKFISYVKFIYANANSKPSMI